MDLYYIGLMSGTSADGIDAVLLRVGDQQALEVTHSLYQPFPKPLTEKILTLQNSKKCSFQALGVLEHQLGHFSSDTVLELLKQSNCPIQNITAIGHHGQTVYHNPDSPYPFTLQLGNPNIIANRTALPVVSDFRRMDMAAGGTGAPLAPILHQLLFSSSTETRVVLNLGGIANCTILSPHNPVVGFDHGPANCLMDSWIQKSNTNQYFDDKGAWAASGTPCNDLLNKLQQDPYFFKKPPKSIGKEYFDLNWLARHLNTSKPILPVDIQATLCELTVSSIRQDMQHYARHASALFLCGGGTHNTFLVQKITQALPHVKTNTIQSLGFSVDYIEAAIFALLAHYRVHNIPGNIPSVTGASKAVVLGNYYLPTTHLSRCKTGAFTNQKSQIL